MSNIFLVGGHDVLFSAQCCKVAVQYKMLGYVLENVQAKYVDQAFIAKCASYLVTCLGKRNISVNLITYATGYLIKV